MPAILVPAAAILVIVFLALRNCGLYPSIFDDEWIYSHFSRLAPMSRAPVPSYLFFLLFRTSNLCGQGFLECVRVFNACFFASAFLFIFLVCRKYASWQLSLFVALLSVLGPLSAYSAYFMPESMYLFAFWVLTWVILKSIKQSWFVLGAGAGTILGLMAMIKAHAVLLLPGFAGFLLLAWVTKSTDKSLRQVLLTIAWTILMFFVVRLSIGYLLVGHAALNLIGKRYGSVMGSSAGGNRQLTLLSMATHSLVGHVLALAFLLGVPLLTAISDYRKPATSDDENRSEIDLRLVRLFAIAFLLPLVLVAALSTAMFVYPPYDTVARLHLRYYDFLFPLFLVIAAGEISSRPMQNMAPRKSWIAAIVVGAILVYAFLEGLKNYTRNSVDCPELLFLSEPKTFAILAVLGFSSLILWAIDKRQGTLIYLFLFVPIGMAAAAYQLNADFRNLIVPDIYEAAGQFARRALGTERSKLVIVGSDSIPLYKALFQVDSLGASIFQIPPGAPFEDSQIPPGKKWILLIGDHTPPATFSYQIPMGQYSLINVSADIEVDLRNSGWPGTFSLVRGLSDPEAFGRWSIDDEVRFDFAFSLPKRFKLTLTAHAFGPNVDLPFKMDVGKQTQLFRLGGSMGKISLDFETDGNEKTVTIKIPMPASPRQLRNLPDDRRLGLALQQLALSDLSQQKQDTASTQMPKNPSP